jgi:hypothetical protein
MIIWVSFIAFLFLLQGRVGVCVGARGVFLKTGCFFVSNKRRMPRKYQKLGNVVGEFLNMKRKDSREHY